MADDLSFHVLDYIVMVAFLLISAAIGIYFGFFKKQTTTDEYLVGGRQMHLLPVSLSLLVTYQSAVSILGSPVEVYLYNTMNFYMFVTIMITNAFQAYVIVPLIHPLKLTSTYEYLGRRFDSRSVQLLGTTMGMLQAILYMCIVLLAPALALESVANIPLWLSIVVVGIVGTIYTSIGGIRTVVWTDVFQCVILFVGLIVILILVRAFGQLVLCVGTVNAGGLENIFDVARDGDRIIFNEFSFDPRVRHTVWGLLIGGFFNWLPNCCSQSSIQRICSMRTCREAKISSLINIPLILLYGIILCLTGILLYSYFTIEKCDPWANGNIDNPNQIVPYLVMRVFKYVPGLSGVFIAALFSGALSSLSSGINSLAANTIQDVLVNKLKESTEMRKTLVAKIVVLVYGILAIAGAYFAKGISGPVTQITWAISGGVGGPMVGILFLGAIFPQANWIGAMSGGIVGIVINLWIAVGSLVYGKKAPLSERIPTSGCTVPSELNLNFTMTTSSPGVMYTVTNATQNVILDSPEGHIPLYDISYIYLGLIGLIVSMLIGLIVSFITGRRREDKVAARYILPFMRRLWNLEDNRASLNGDFHPVETNLW